MSRRALLVATILCSMGAKYPPQYTRQYVDLVELNHFHDDQAKLVFSQVIWWQWIGWISEYRVIDWRIDRNAHPRYDWRRKVWISHWSDKKNRGIYRKVYATYHRETWTQHDPELEDRKYLPENMRSGLVKG